MLAIFGIDNDLISLGVSLAVLIVIVFWLGLVAFTFLDARRRINDSFLVVCATVAAFIFPFIGVIVYTMLRPPEFLEDARERDLEVRATELRVAHLLEASCPNCEFPVDRSYLRCPRCRARIKEPCETCSKPIDPRWSLCPYCEAPNRRAQQRRSARQSEAAGKSSGSRGLRRSKRAPEPVAATEGGPDDEPPRKPRESSNAKTTASTSRPSRSPATSTRQKQSPAARVQAGEVSEQPPPPRRSSRSSDRPADGGDRGSSSS